MERLTEYSCGVAVIKDKRFIQKAIYNLAHYEDTELTPEEVKAMKDSKSDQVDYSLLEYYKTLGTPKECREHEKNRSHTRLSSNNGRIQSVYADMSSQETLGMDTMTFQSKEKRNTVRIAVRNCSGMIKNK